MTQMYVWGKASSGQLALGGIEEDLIKIPVEVPHYEGFTSKVLDVACGWEHTAFLTNDGIVYTCGNNDFGQLGHSKSSKRPERIDALETMTITKVACGQDFTMALTDKGRVLSWGNNSNGQIGHPISDIIHHRPRNIKFFNDLNVIQVCCGMQHSLALTTDGRLFSWGNNSHGQLGVGKNVANAADELPNLVTALLGVPLVAISAGAHHSMALGFSGAVFGWGKNSFGQLGLDNETDQVLPVHIESIRSQRVRHIVCGEDHTAVLTEDGGVFTFGAGTCGQLGHNSNSHQNQPRKVLELMGTIVTQIDCGRRHTVAFAPESGRVYAFGLGACGQLGSGTTVNCNSPVVAKGPWLSASRSTANDSRESIFLTKIVAGGDHCFVLASTPVCHVDPFDMRHLNPSQLLTMVSSDLAEEITQHLNDNSITQEMSKTLETVFSSQQCLNGSFFNTKKILVADSHNHAVDLSSVRKFFQALSKNESMNESILNHIETNLFPYLNENPLDIDSLRLFIILPEFQMFRKPERYQTLAIPFATKLYVLSDHCQKIIGHWWAKLPSTYFEGIIKIFQEAIKYIQLLLLPDEIKERYIRICFEMLKALYKVNSAAENPVSYTVFYIPELNDDTSIDLKEDYIRWLQNELTENNQKKELILSFCNYPFVFDPKAKYVLLQTDAQIQMQSAFQEAHEANLGNLIFSGIIHEMINPFLVLHVNRDNIVRDSLSQVMKLAPMDYKKQLHIVFKGEQAVDAGGVKKEFFLLLMKEILDPNFGMFKTIEENNLIWFNKHSFEDNVMFLLIGVICGLAIYNSTIIDLPFPPLLYNKLLKRPVTLEDFRTFQPSIAKHLQDLLDYPEEEVEATFALDFQINDEFLGVVNSENLMPDGEHVAVTGQNRGRYVELYIDYVVNKSVEKQFDAFSHGFHRVCGGRVLEFFHPQELMEMIVGIQEYDFNELEKGAEYLGEYYGNHPVIQNFWNVFYEFDASHKKKFLAFLTGTDRVPLTGIRSLNIKIQPVIGGRNNDHLPVAHTCFNLLDLPRYATKEIMKQKLEQAVSYSSGFGLA